MYHFIAGLIFLIPRRAADRIQTVALDASACRKFEITGKRITSLFPSGNITISKPILMHSRHGFATPGHYYAKSSFSIDHISAPVFRFLPITDRNRYAPRYYFLTWIPHRIAPDDIKFMHERRLIQFVLPRILLLVDNFETITTIVELFHSSAPVIYDIHLWTFLLTIPEIRVLFREVFCFSSKQLRSSLR